MKAPVALRKKIVALISAGVFSLPYEATDIYVPIHDPKELKTLQVLVRISSRRAVRANREDFENEIGIDVGIQKHVKDISTEENDSIADFAEETIQFLQKPVNQALQLDDDDLSRVRLVQIDSDEVHKDRHLRQSNVFTNVVTYIYQVF